MRSAARARPLLRGAGGQLRSRAESGDGAPSPCARVLRAAVIISGDHCFRPPACTRASAT
jgi:hypothetical protein